MQGPSTYDLAHAAALAAAETREANHTTEEVMEQAMVRTPTIDIPDELTAIVKAMTPKASAMQDINANNAFLDVVWGEDLSADTEVTEEHLRRVVEIGLACGEQAFSSEYRQSVLIACMRTQLGAIRRGLLSGSKVAWDIVIDAAHMYWDAADFATDESDGSSEVLHLAAGLFRRFVRLSGVNPFYVAAYTWFTTAVFGDDNDAYIVSQLLRNAPTNAFLQARTQALFAVLEPAGRFITEAQAMHLAVAASRVFAANRRAQVTAAQQEA